MALNITSNIRLYYLINHTCIAHLGMMIETQAIFSMLGWLLIAFVLLLIF